MKQKPQLKLLGGDGFRVDGFMQRDFAHPTRSGSIPGTASCEH